MGPDSHRLPVPDIRDSVEADWAFRPFMRRRGSFGRAERASHPPELGVRPVHMGETASRGKGEHQVALCALDRRGGRSRPGALAIKSQEVSVCELLRVAEVRQDDPRARARILELIEIARGAAAHLRPDQIDANGSAVIEATWTASRAAGFLEACALIYPLMADDLMSDFESLAAFVDELSAARTAAASQVDSQRSTDRRKSARAEQPPRRVAVRRLVPERRVKARRQQGDRRGW
jgi:hypothetical protein